MVNKQEFNITSADGFFIGEDKTLLIDVVQSDGSTAQNMDSWALIWELMTSPTGSVVLTKITGSGITIGDGDGTDDRATVVITDEDTEGLSAGPARYYHRLRRSDANTEYNLSWGFIDLRANAGTA